MAGKSWILWMAAAGVLAAAPGAVSFSQSAPTIEVYDFVEVSAQVDGPDAVNCFTDAALSGSFARSGEKPANVEGFCDAMDGSVYRIRFMPAAVGEYRYELRFR